MVGAAACRYGFSECECGQIALALDEALCNVIKHGYGGDEDRTIWICVVPQEEPSGIRIVVEDEGVRIDPSMIRSRPLDEIRPGGLGVYIIEQIMDHVVYEQRSNVGMRLIMEKTVGNDVECETQICGKES